MNILTACECSGVVREAFRAKGHNAWSCDIKPAEDSQEFHLECDVLDMIGPQVHAHTNGEEISWDMIIGFPPCTHLASSGAQYWKSKREDGRQQKAVDFFLQLMNAPCNKVAIENPVGFLSTAYRKPDQIIQPFQFGNPVMKKTCLWLRGLPTLRHTDVVKPEHAHCSSSKRGGPRKDGTRRVNPLPVKYGDSLNRSRTFSGIAKAMAEQWG